MFSFQKCKALLCLFGSDWQAVAADRGVGPVMEEDRSFSRRGTGQGLFGGGAHAEFSAGKGYRAHRKGCPVVASLRRFISFQ